MIKRLTYGFMLFGIVAIIFFVSACGGKAQVEDKAVAPILSLKAVNDWQTTSDCLIRSLDETTKAGVLGMPSSNALRPDWGRHESLITIRRASDMTMLYTMSVKDDGAGGSIITGVPHQDLRRDAYSDMIEAAMRASGQHCTLR